MVSIRIFDFQKLSQGHELQCRQICRWIAFYALLDGKKMADQSQTNSCDPPMRHVWTHEQADESYRQQCNALHFALKKTFNSI